MERDGFENMTYPKEVITEALHLYVEGLSLSKIRDVIYQHHGYRISDGSILNWMRKYAKLVGKLERRIKPKVKGRIHLDEVQVKVGKKRAGARTPWIAEPNTTS